MKLLTSTRKIISKYRNQSIVLISILLLITVLFISSGEHEQYPVKSSIEGYLIDSQTGIGLNNEFCVRLEQYGTEDNSIHRYWPNDSDNRGYFRFNNITPGKYRITLARSWTKVTLNDPNDRYIEGGWTIPESVEIEVSGERLIQINFSLDFHAYQIWNGNLRGIQILGSVQTVFGYSDDNFFGDNTNLIGKTMTFSVYWNNSNLAHADFTVTIMDLVSSTEEQYEVGSQIEVLTIEIDEEFIEYEDQYELADWTVDARVLPSFDPEDIEYSIIWTIE